MRQQPFPSAASTLSTPDLAQRVLGKYELSEPIQCHLFKRGVNDTYKVQAGSSTYFLRVYRHGFHTRGEIEAELDMLLHLGRRRVSVSTPIARRDGAYLTRIRAPEGVRYAALFTNAKGGMTMFNRREGRSYGELVARVHVCLDGMHRDRRRPDLDMEHLIWRSLHHIEPFLAHRRKDFDYLREVGSEFTQKIEGLLPKTSPQFGYIHADLNFWNVHFSTEGVPTLIDFDFCGNGWRAYDLAVFPGILDMYGEQDSAGRAKMERVWKDYLAGYQKVRRLGKRELEATHIFVPVRHIWLMGWETSMADVWGHSSLTDGHFNWAITVIKRWIRTHELL